MVELPQEPEAGILPERSVNVSVAGSYLPNLLVEKLPKYTALLKESNMRCKTVAPNEESLPERSVNVSVAGSYLPSLLFAYEVEKYSTWLKESYTRDSIESNEEIFPERFVKVSSLCFCTPLEYLCVFSP